MGVAANLSVGFAARDEREFAMSFQADDAVENLHAGILKIARPTDVGGFVEARLQLDHHGDFFRGGGFDQGADDGRIFAGAIERLLDRKHIGILRRAFDEAHDRGIGIVRMVEKNIAFSHFFKQG